MACWVAFPREQLSVKTNWSQLSASLIVLQTSFSAFETLFFTRESTARTTEESKGTHIGEEKHSLLLLTKDTVCVPDRDSDVHIHESVNY